MKTTPPELNPLDYPGARPPLAGRHEPGPGLGHHLYASVVATITLTVLLCGVYPAIVWGISQLPGLRDKANGSLIKDAQGNVIGSSLIGQSFSADKYFHSRPSSAGSGYDPTSSSGSNLGPTSAKLFNGTTKKDDKGNETGVDFDGIKLRVFHYCKDNNILLDSSQPLDGFKDASGNWDDLKLVKAFGDDKAPLVITPKQSVPADAVTASASGLDPHISIVNAEIQAARVAAARGMDVQKVKALIVENTDGPQLGILGDAGVNVLKLNLALDAARP